MQQFVIGLVSGAVGGIVLGALIRKYSLGTLGNTVVGMVGGGIGSYLLGIAGVTGALLPGALDEAAGDGFNDVVMAIALGLALGAAVLAAVAALRGRAAG